MGILIESEAGDCYTEITRTTKTSKPPRVKNDKTLAEVTKL